MSDLNDLELRVCARYRLYQKIGGGAFGMIYRARNAQNNLECAIKMEEIRTKHPQVLYEGKIMQNLQGGPGIPSMYWCGQEGDFNFLVMEYLDCNLADLQAKCGGKFSLRCVLLIIDKILKNVEYVHFKSYIHRDFKPENFMIGKGKKSNQFYTIDFGLSKKYIDINTHQHIPWREKKPLIGTARYASINAHKGCELGRRDDLESLAYMFVFLLTGTLPWQGISARNKDEKHIKVKQMKMNMSNEDICDGCPKQFATFLAYSKSLKFDERPSYSYVQSLFSSLADELNYNYDNVFDWYLIQQKDLDIPDKNENEKEYYRLPFNEDIIENEQQFIESLNLQELEEDIDLKDNNVNNSSSDIMIPLDEIQLTEGERLQREKVQDQLDKNWKQQQMQCVKILKEQQFLVNERDMNLTSRSIQKSQSISSKQARTTATSQNNTNNSDQQQNQQQYNNNNNYRNQQQQHQINTLGGQQQDFMGDDNMSVTQRGGGKPNLTPNNFQNNQNNSYNNNTNSNNNNLQQKQQRPGHQKKKSGCNIF